jgi:hypothetical protein
LIFLTAIGVALGAASVAFAQTTISTTPPNINEQMFPNTPGQQRGLQDLNNSGQVGTVVLHKHGDASTEIVLNVKGTVEGRPERAGILRYPPLDCTTFPKNAPMTLQLSPVENGHSTTVVPRGIGELLSGNYLVLVYSSEKTSHVFSCGRLYK